MTVVMATENDLVVHGSIKADKHDRKRCTCGGRGRLVLENKIAKVRFGFYKIVCESCGKSTAQVEILERACGGVNKPLAKEQAVSIWNKMNEEKKQGSSFVSQPCEVARRL